MGSDSPAIHWRCPRCNGENELRITGQITLMLLQNEPDDKGNFQTVPTGGHDWDDKSAMTCRSCDYTAAAKKFEYEAAKPDEDGIAMVKTLLITGPDGLEDFSLHVDDGQVLEHLYLFACDHWSEQHGERAMEGAGDADSQRTVDRFFGIRGLGWGYRVWEKEDPNLNPIDPIVVGGTLRGGVFDIDEIPRGVRFVLDEYDIQGLEEDERITEDDNGEKYLLRQFGD